MIFKFESPTPPFTPCLLIVVVFPPFLFLHLPDLLYSYFLAVHSRLAVSFFYNVLSLPVPTACL